MSSNNVQVAQPTEVAPQPKKTGFLTDFVNNYVPDNEQTYNFAIPIIGFASSCISFGMFMTYIHYAKDGRYVYSTMYSYGYMVLAGAAGIELHYGLRNRNRKQYTFWILIKIIEMLLILIAAVDALARTNNEIDFAVIGIILIVIKIILLYYIMRRARSKKNRAVIPEENMYDLPRSPTNTSIYLPRTPTSNSIYGNEVY